MKIIYLDCGMGAAGDMLTAALLELHPSPEDFVQHMNSLEIPGVQITAKKDSKCGIAGTNVTVSYFNAVEGDSHHHEHHTHSGHHHMSVSEINNVIGGLNLSEKVKNDALNVFHIIAKAESEVHGQPIENIHFHELGTMDAVADILCVCMLVNELAPDVIVASPVNVGGGTVKCAHGIMPVPAPATARILMGVPVYSGSIKSELCTPTGAALLKYFVKVFESLPQMSVERIGCGMGDKDFDIPNCVRAFMGESPDSSDEILVLSCNIDDMTGEALGFACDRLFEAGALDVYTIPINMKKSRPGVILQCICMEADKDQLVSQMFKHTTTLGIRLEKCSRYTLSREISIRDTPYGEVRVKQANGWGVSRAKAEYEDIAGIAMNNGISIDEVRKNIGLY